MKAAIFLAFALSTLKSFGQNVVSYYDGTPALEVKYTNVEGSELLHPDWLAGSVTTKQGRTITGLKLKYNQLEDRLYYIDSNSISMMFVTPIQEFVIGDSMLGFKNKTFRNGFPSIEKFGQATYFEILVEGKIVLLKKTLKNIIETKDYNSPITKKQIIDDNHYYVYDNKQIILLKKDISLVTSILQNKVADIENFMAVNKLNLKKEIDLIKLITYYNGL